MVDAVGKPFLIQGDTAWSLIAQLTREDADLYLEDRRARGFNTILVSLIEAKFATNAPANAYGQPPFLKPGPTTLPTKPISGMPIGCCAAPRRRGSWCC